MTFECAYAISRVIIMDGLDHNDKQKRFLLKQNR